MHIHHTHGTWYVIDHVHKTVTRDTNMQRCLSNALYKYFTYDNTPKPEGNAYDLYMQNTNV